MDCQEKRQQQRQALRRSAALFVMALALGYMAVRAQCNRMGAWQDATVTIEDVDELVIADAKRRGVDLSADRASSIVGGSVPSEPREVDTEAAIAWTKEEDGTNALADLLSAHARGAVRSDSAEHLAADESETVERQNFQTVGEDVIDNSLKALQPVVWREPIFDGEPENFSPEDFVKAKEVLARYDANFSAIKSMSLRYQKLETGLANLASARPAIDDMATMSFDIEATRAPLFFRLRGRIGKVDGVEEIITPAGKISSGHFGFGGSAVPAYLDGEGYFSGAALLKHGDCVRSNVPMEYALPGLAELAEKAKGKMYDVILLAEDGSDVTDEYWFDQEAGMLGFVVQRKGHADTGANPFCLARGFEYQSVGEIHYPKRIVSCEYDGQTKSEAHYADLVINGASPEILK